jgi:hypothetical protein
MPRKEERLQYFAEITLESAAGTHGARISDISRGGCYIDTIAPAQEGEEISFIFENAADAGLRFTGIVTYVLENMGFGIKFTRLTNAHFDAIEQIINKSAG